MASVGGVASGVKRTRYYRELLTPLLHRRFTGAAGLTLLLCWAEATLIGSSSSLIWSWFPLGPAGIRTLLLFISCLTIFVMRVAHLHFGLRTAPSLFTGLTQHLCQWTTLQTFGGYLFSAWFFSEVYVWSVPKHADLSWVAEGKAYERQRLNERPIYLRSHYFLLAFYQSLHHIFSDIDRIRLPSSGPVSQENAKVAPPSLSAPSQSIRERLPAVIASASKRTAVLSICNLFIYALIFRRWAFAWSLSFARIIWNIPRSSEPPKIPPYHYSLIIRSLVSGTLLVLLWDVSNVIFDAYVAQQAVKKGKPLTDESSDPNGSLLNGLKSKKELVRTFAFWELLTIAQCFEPRRRAIFSDLDRNGGSAWNQILKISLEVIENVNTRIIDKKAPPPEMTLGKKVPLPEGLPRLAEPLKEGTIFSPASKAKATSRRERYGSRAGAVAKYYGTSKSEQNPLMKLLVAARDKVLTKEQQKALNIDTLLAKCFEVISRLLRTPVGAPFRQTFASRSRAKILGTPSSDLEAIEHAVGAITCLAAFSINEDQYGTVHKDIPLILRTLVNITGAVEKFLRESPIHWSDVDFQEANGEGRHVEQIDELLLHLKSSLRFLISTFEEYAKDMGLGAVEVREARKAAGLPVSGA